MAKTSVGLTTLTHLLVKWTEKTNYLNYMTFTFLVREATCWDKLRPEENATFSNKSSNLNQNIAHIICVYLWNRLVEFFKFFEPVLSRLYHTQIWSYHHGIVQIQCFCPTVVVLSKNCNQCFPSWRFFKSQTSTKNLTCFEIFE